MSRPLHVCYLLDSTELCGGVRIVLDQARALRALGHRVTVRARGGSHDWYPHSAEVAYVEGLDAPFSGSAPDVVVATFWTTVPMALRLNAPLTAHLCQGLEWRFPEYAAVHAQIEAAYRQPILKLTVGPWLVEQLHAHFGAHAFPAEDVGQIVDTDIFRPAPWWLRLQHAWRRPPYRVLVVGVFQSWFKGINIALQAVARLRKAGLDVHLTRVSTVAASDEESGITPIDAYWRNLAPSRMAALYHDADLLLAPSRTAEGFGLPLFEAVASGLPAVASDIPSYRLLAASSPPCVSLVPEGDAAAMAAAAQRLLLDRGLRASMARHGPARVRARFSVAAVGARLEAVFTHYLNGGRTARAAG